MTTIPSLAPIRLREADKRSGLWTSAHFDQQQLICDAEFSGKATKVFEVCSLYTARDTSHAGQRDERERAMHRMIRESRCRIRAAAACKLGEFARKTRISIRYVINASRKARRKEGSHMQ